MKLVFCESFNWRHKNYSDRFLLEERGDRSLALLGVSKILRSQLVTKRRYRYLRKTYQWSVSTKCRLQTGYKMQNRYKMQTADCVQNADCGFKLFFFFYPKSDNMSYYHLLFVTQSLFRDHLSRSFALFSNIR